MQYNRIEFYIFYNLVFFNVNIVFILEKTYRKAPQKPPSSVHMRALNPTTVKVVWRYVTPSQEEEPLKGYKVSKRNLSFARSYQRVPLNIMLSKFVKSALSKTL